MKTRIRLQKQDIIKIIIAAGFVILTCASFGLYYFVLGAQEIAMDELSGVKDQLSTLQSLAKVEKIPLVDQMKIGKDLLEAQRGMPSTQDIPQLLIEFYKLFIEYGLEANSINFGQITEEEKYNSFTINFDILGDKKDVYGFLNLLENYPREITYENLSFNVSDEEKFKVVLALKMYLSKDKVAQSEKVDYDFMNGIYGSYSNWYDFFQKTKVNEPGR